MHSHTSVDVRHCYVVERRLCWVMMGQVPVSVVFTKLDKRKKKTPKPEQNILGTSSVIPISVLLCLQSWNFTFGRYVY